MPDAKHDNKLWLWCGRINRLLFVIGFIGFMALCIIASERWPGNGWAFGALILLAILLVVLLCLLGRSMPRLLTFRCRPYVAHPCPYCGAQPDSDYGCRCPNGDPIKGYDVAEWNRRAEIISDYLESDRTCEYCGKPIVIHGDWTENDAVEYTAECGCVETSARYPDDAISDRADIARKRDRRNRRMNEPDIIAAKLNGETEKE